MMTNYTVAPKFITQMIFFSLSMVWGSLNAQDPIWQWAKSIGGIGDDRIASISVDPGGSGNVYATGNFEGTVDFDPGEGTLNLTSNGGWDVYISKWDASGNLIWVKSFGGVENDNCTSIVADVSGNLYVAGSYSGTVDFDPGTDIVNVSATGLADIFICRFDTTGNLVWTKSIGGSGVNSLFSMVIDPDGNGGIYATGQFNETTDFDPDTTAVYNLTAADFDIYIFKLNSSGDFVWAKSMGSTAYDVAYSISIDPEGAGSVYTTGSFRGTVDFNPDPTGIFNLTATGNQCLFISKLDRSGNFIWAEAITGPKNVYGKAIAINPSGGEIYITGLFNGTVDFDPGDGHFDLTANGFDFFIAKFGSMGNLIWVKAIGGANFDFATSIAVDPGGNGDVYTTGFFSGIVDFDPGSETSNLSSIGVEDVFISKVDRSGNFIWAKSMGGSKADYGASLSADLEGQLYVGGYFLSSSMSMDSITLINTSNSGTTPDLFIARFGESLPTAVSEMEENPVSFYPNPVTSALTIKLSSSASDIIMLRVVSITGQMLMEERGKNGNAIQTIEVNDLPQGMYFLQIVLGGRVLSVHKFVKQ